MRLKTKNGFVYLLALGVMMASLSIGVAFLQLSRMETKISQNQHDIFVAMLNAESALDFAMAEIRHGNNTDGSPGIIGEVGPRDLDGDSSTDFHAVKGTGTITADGMSGGITRQINADVSVAGTMIYYWTAH